MPLDASPTSAHTAPRLELELAHGAIALDRDAQRRHEYGAQSEPRYTAGSPGLPPAQEALDRRMEHDLVELRAVEEPMAAHGGVVRRGRLERAAGEIAGEDDVHDVLRRERTLRRDRVDDRDRALDRDLVLDADLFAQLAVQRVREALARVDAAAGQEPVVAAAGLLVPAEQDAVLPAQHGGDADARLERHHTADEPNPRTPRSLVGQLVDFDGLDLRNRQHDELRDAHARLDDERLARGRCSAG